MLLFRAVTLFYFITGIDGHQGALTCLDTNKDGSLVLTGSVDGQAKLINTITGKVGHRLLSLS